MAPLDTISAKGSVDAGWIAARLADIFGLDSVGPVDDFFELGGDSTAAVALMTEIEAETGLKLPISVLLEAPTPARLAAHIAGGQTAHHPSLLPVEEEGTGAPLFLVHGLLGQVFLARYLRGHLGSRPIWGIQAQPQDPTVTTPKSVEALAEEYIAIMKSVRPTGPWLIGGYCAGSFIAWEMAQRLTRAGEQVPLIFAIDPPPIAGDHIGGRAPAPGTGPLDDRHFISRARLNLRRTSARHEDFHWIRDDKEAQRQAIRTAAALRQAYLAYRPAPYGGPVVFLCSANKARLIRQPQFLWYGLIGGPPSIERLAGRHTDLFIPNDPTLGTAMKRALDARGL